MVTVFVITLDLKVVTLFHMINKWYWEDGFNIPGILLYGNYATL